MNATITTVCLAAHVFGMSNADEVCQQSEIVVELSEKYDIAAELIISLVYHESRWNPKVVSRAGACGLTQVIPKWSRNPRLTCKQLKEDPILSLRTGIGTLNRILLAKRYANGNMKVALCMYNAGPSNCRYAGVSQRGNRYSRKVLKTSKKIRQIMTDLESEPEYEVF